MPDIIPIDPTQAAAPEQYDAEFFDFQKFKVRLDRRIGDWKHFKEAAIQNRKDRKLDLDIEQARKDGLINENETYVPTRVIDSNIQREKADAMNFLNGSKRLIYFHSVEDPTIDTEQLESDVTKGLTYPNWYKAFEKHYDGAALHGWDCIEVMYDESRPLHVSFEHCGFDKVFFNTQLEDIQDDEFIMREYKVSCLRLDEFVEQNNFDAQQVDQILEKNSASQKRDNQIFTIYKVYFKYKSQVWICWYTKETNVSDFLKKPEQLKCGLLTKTIPPQVAGAIQLTPQAPAQPEFVDAPVEQYPIFLFVYREDEEMEITKHNGRAFYDAPQQEARTAVKTGYVNGILRASEVFACATSDDPEATNRLEEITLEGGKILPAPLNFFSPPFPDPTILQGLQYMDMENSQQTGKMAQAVSNRKDARKTAKELDLAENEEQKITSTGLATYSEFLRLIYDFSWKIIRSQALANRIFLCRVQIQQQIPSEIPGATIPQVMFVNNEEVIGKQYDIRAAGDIDVVQRNQTLQDMQQDWPVLQAIPGVNQAFLKKYIKLRYPLDAPQFLQAMEQGNIAKQLVQGLATALQAMSQMHPEDLRDGNKQGQLMQLLQSAQQFMSNPAA